MKICSGPICVIKFTKAEINNRKRDILDKDNLKNSNL